MFIVLFEVQPKESEWDRYLELAGWLRPKLEQIPGFLENERYESERTAGRVLSLSLWESEKALVRWRTHGEHHGVQEQGRFEVFEDYHLRIGEVVADGVEGEHEPSRLDVTEVGAAKASTVTEVDPGAEAPPTPADSSGLVDAEWFSGINTEGKRLLLASWRDDDAAQQWLSEQTLGSRTRRVRIVRDYGMHDRREAPQYFPAVQEGADRF
ncbi:MAG: antibiotic biosynthesis monooxygenase family protein [Solirubrobacteraceae bacterium]